MRLNLRNALSNAFVGSGGGADATKLPLAGGTLTGPLTITGGTVTTSTPLLIQTQTWNGGTVAFKTNTINVVNTASKAYSDTTWADVSTSWEIQDSGVAKLALIPKGSENSAMLRLGGSDANHALLKDAQTAGGIIFRGSGGLGDFACVGRMGDGNTGVTVANFNGLGRIGFNATALNMGGGNSAADAFFQRGGAAASIQMGATSATPVNQLFTGPSGTGTNITGGKLSIGPGKSTGNATPATVVLQGTAAGSSGATAQTLVDVLTITNSALVTLSSGVGLQLGNAAALGAVVPTHTLTIRDSTGTVYRIPCLI